MFTVIFLLACPQYPSMTFDQKQQVIEYIIEHDTMSKEEYKKNVAEYCQTIVQGELDE